MTTRQKRIEDDNNKKWAQVRYSKLVYSDRSLPNFDNTNYWNELSESSSWTTNGVRGQALPDPYYNGYTVNDQYTTPIDDLLMHIGFIKAATVELVSVGSLIGTSIAASGLEKIFEYIYWNINKVKLAALLKGAKDAETFEKFMSLFVEACSKLAVNTPIVIARVLAQATVLWFIGMGFLAGNTYLDVYKAWNEFEQDSINCQHRADTEVDDEGNPLWSGYKVVYNIDYGNTTTTQAGQMKLFQHHRLVRGRYKSDVFSNYSVTYTFKWTKSITMIPA